MKKFVLSMLLGACSGIVLYLTYDLIAMKISSLASSIDLMDQHTVHLGSSAPLVFCSLGEDDLWMSNKVTVEQLAQYCLSENKDLWFESVRPCSTNDALPDAAAMTTLKGASEFCRWLTQREYSERRLPKNYYYAVVRDVPRNYTANLDEGVLSNGFLVIMCKKISAVEMVSSIVKAIWIGILENPVISSFVVMGIVVWIIVRKITGRGAKERRQSSDGA